ncbi:TadE/TadG family type IV pilus assembly protein [Bordetella genomosp. 12]|uniref:TadE/TadG family type IV pilus assembly protein n=1 Tax=Bordetella genomosp. 12 TaxID=463035 RepID=UPI001ABF1690|nr:TadE/TadG family type IV pilus assembly protein [Bordetella genomosp. 12]
MFLVFFLVVYGILTWGLIFAAQQSVNYAAEEGARIALRWQSADAMGVRAQQARSEALRQLSWVQSMGRADASIAVCGAGGLVQGEGACSGAALDPDQLEVLVRYPYSAGPLVPVLPGILPWLPAQLAARASVRLGGSLEGR